MAKRVQPAWHPPENSYKPKLKLYNSLTREKEEFVPQFGNKVLWYSCGPTVYDAAHMGHARSYISFDILRRVLSEYFAYDVFYVMNITDIDDKIIKRARQKHLFAGYAKSNCNLDKVVEDVRKAITLYKELVKKTDDPDKITMLNNTIVKTESAVNMALSNAGAGDSSEVVKSLITDCEAVISEWQDNVKSNSEFDNSIFLDFSAEWEDAFYSDMEALNVLQPDAVTRVTEFIPEILGYIERIIEKGLAYVSNGSVYFDTLKFDQAPNHFYGKLVPEAFGDLKMLQEGEGELSVSSERLSEKKNMRDFALWKASKPGEPSWKSPWGMGRPGWHIECSVMASALLGESMDIHTGGFDLKFPHHDNELAQSEAYFGNDHWVRYFLHSGHLTISGCKMSKSLKNFVTIGDALRRHTSRQIRLAFLTHAWKDTLDYGPQTMEGAVGCERMTKEFFLNTKDAIRDIPKRGREAFQKWGEDEHNLHKVFQQTQDKVHESLCDNIDTRSAIENLTSLITSTNVYVSSKKSKQTACNRKFLTNIMAYISRIFRIFGAEFDHSSTAASSPDAASKIDEDMVMPYLRTMADFRENIRLSAIEIKAPSILKLCDELRDDILPNLGVRLEDQEGLKSAIKLEDPAELLREREMKLKLEAEKQLEKERKKQEQEALKAQREAAKRVPPNEMFLSMTDKYSKFNEKGIPTHDVGGKELSESQLKKVMKLYSAQEKKFKEYLKSVPASNGADC